MASTGRRSPARNAGMAAAMATISRLPRIASRGATGSKADSTGSPSASALDRSSGRLPRTPSGADGAADQRRDEHQPDEARHYLSRREAERLDDADLAL